MPSPSTHETPAPADAPAAIPARAALLVLAMALLPLLPLFATATACVARGSRAAVEDPTAHDPGRAVASRLGALFLHEVD